MVKISLEEEIGRAENRFHETKPDVAESDVLEITVGYIAQANQDYIIVSYQNKIKRKTPTMLSSSYLKTRGITEIGQRIGLVWYIQNGNEVRDVVSLVDSDGITKLRLDSIDMKNPFGVYY